MPPLATPEQYTSFLRLFYDFLVNSSSMYVVAVGVWCQVENSWRTRVKLERGRCNLSVLLAKRDYVTLGLANAMTNPSVCRLPSVTCVHPTQGV